MPRKCLKFLKLSKISCKGVKSMDDFVFEKSDIDGLDSLVMLRIAYLLEDHGTIPQEQLTKISEKLPVYFRKHLNNDLFVYTAKSENEIIIC